MKGLTKKQKYYLPFAFGWTSYYLTFDPILIICTLDTINLQIITMKSESKEYLQNLV